MSDFGRRRFMKTSMVAGLGSLWVPGAFAELLSKTPAQAEGPFYPNKLPLDTDNDLLVINDGVTPGVGKITHLHGAVTDVKGNPLRNALVEIWQVDNKGAYLHSKDPRNKLRDKNFQGYGRFSTNQKGEYYFRTIQPVAYPGRTPHIHVMVSHKGKRLLTTQMYVNKNPLNGKDFLLKRAGELGSMLCVDFKPIPGSKIGELSAKFNIVVGVTPEDKE